MNITRHAETSEKALERYLTHAAQASGLPCLKYTNANMAGYPDRILLLPGGAGVWVELKSRGRKPTRLQAIRHEALRAIGHRVEVIDGPEAIDALLEGLQ